MNARIFDTTSGPLLVFRDLDEDSQEVLVLRMYPPDGTIVSQQLKLQSDQSLPQIIDKLAPATVERMARDMMNLWIVK